MHWYEWVAAAFAVFIVFGSLLYNPVTCCICDGPMFRIGPTKLKCFDCGWEGNG